MKRCIFIITILLLYLPVAIFGFVIDSMESTSSFSTGGDNNVTWGLSGTTGKVGNCVKMDYTFEGGTWLQIYKNYDYISLAAGDVIKFWYKGSGNANTIEFYLEDINGNSKTLYFNRESDTPNWTEKVIELSNFNSLNLYKISKIKFAVSKQTGDDGGSGSLYIDKVELYQSINVSSFFTNIDDFEDTSDATNLLNGQNFAYKNGSTTSTISATTPNSNFCTLQYIKGTGTGFASWIIKLQGIDISQYEYLKFQIWGSTGSEKIGIGLMNSDYENGYINPEQYLTEGEITTSSQWCLIPITHFGLSKITNMSELKIVFQDDDNETGFGSQLGTGDTEIMIDNLMFYTAPRSAGFIKTIDDMDLAPRYSAWDSYYDSAGSSIDVSLVDGYDGKAYKIDYNLGTGSWVTIERNFYLNLFEGGGIKFYLKGEGDSNNLEVKLEDSDGTTYWRKFYNITDTDNVWKEIAFGFDEISFFSSGDDDNLNLKKIKTIYLAISQYEDGKQGTVYIDELRCESLTSYKSEFDADKIFKQVEVDNIPFSPNNDNYKDTVAIKFILNQKAMVSLRIYNLAGNIIKEFPAEEYQSGNEYSFEWDGKDFDNKIVRNGIYFFQLKAQTYEGEIERVNYGIAVVK